jgi:hypothetical protein
MARDKRLVDDPPARSEESFLSRWLRRKLRPRSGAAAEQSSRHRLEAARESADSQSLTQTYRGAVAAETDADTPPIEDLDRDSDYSAFMSPKVSPELRRQALRKLFHQPEFNVRNRLDCHVGDFTRFEPLGDTVTADMRHQMERTARARSTDLGEHGLKESPADDRAVQQARDRESVRAAGDAASKLSDEDRGNRRAEHERQGAGEES